MPPSPIPQSPIPWQHGGIPVCFPWFGTNGPVGSPLHGLVRSRLWTVEKETSSSVTLTLDSDSAMHEWFAGEFRLTLEVTLAASLDLRLTVENTGSEPFAYTNGLHPYFKVADCAQTFVDGVDGCKYWYGTGFAERPWQGLLPLDVQRDHVFWIDSHRQVLTDPAANRRIVVTTSGNRRIVVWNPGPEGSAGLPSGDWRRFVCVEPATIPAEDGFTVRPGEKQTLELDISVERT